MKLETKIKRTKQKMADLDQEIKVQKSDLIGMRIARRELNYELTGLMVEVKN